MWNIFICYEEKNVEPLKKQLHPYLSITASSDPAMAAFPCPLWIKVTHSDTYMHFISTRIIRVALLS